MDKINNKKNLSIIILTSLSLIIILNNFYRFFRNNAVYQFDSWLSNYQGGFVRRGFPGEFFFQIYEIFNVHIGWLTFFSISLFYFLFYLFFFKLLKDIELNKIFILTIFSPLSFFFPVLNSKATGHKEILYFLLLAILCYFLPRIKKKSAIFIICLSTIVLGLSHEGLLFYTLYLIIPFFLFYNFFSFKNFLFNISPILIITILMFLLNYHFSGSAQHVKDICSSVESFVNSNCEHVGQIAHLNVPLKGYLLQKIAVGSWQDGMSTLYPEYFLIYGIGFVLGFLPIFILSKILQVNKIFYKEKFSDPLVILFFPLLFTVPIYVIGADWGRYFHISYISSLLIFVFCIKNKIYHMENKYTKPIKNKLANFVFIVFLVFYGFGWSVPICCEKEFKGGIISAVERVIYYYNIRY